jgi:hypothetical protein
MALSIIEDARLGNQRGIPAVLFPGRCARVRLGFPCDAAGNVDEATLHPDGLDNLRCAAPAREEVGAPSSATA